MQASESAKINSDQQPLVTATNLNDKISYLKRKRSKLQEIEQKY